MLLKSTLVIGIPDSDRVICWHCCTLPASNGRGHANGLVMALADEDWGNDLAVRGGLPLVTAEPSEETLAE